MRAAIYDGLPLLYRALPFATTPLYTCIGRRGVHKINMSKSPPSYEESFNTQTLTSRLSSTRAARVSWLIAEHLEPALAEQAAAGLHRVVTVIIPSSVSALQSPDVDTKAAPGADEVEPVLIGMPLDATLRTVRLRGPENSLEFWRQAQAQTELKSALEARLAAQGHLIHCPRAPALVAVEEVARKKRGFGWRRDRVEVATPFTPVLQDGQDVLSGHVRVRVDVQEITMRVVTEMGLYDSRTGPALVVDVELG